MTTPSPLPEASKWDAVPVTLEGRTLDANGFVDAMWSLPNLTMCPDCFAVVPSQWQGQHEAWHEAVAAWFDRTKDVTR